MTLALLAQWQHFCGERYFWRFNRWVRALEPEMCALQQALAEDLAKPSVFRVLERVASNKA